MHSLHTTPAPDENPRKSALPAANSLLLPPFTCPATGHFSFLASGDKRVEEEMLARERLRERVIERDRVQRQRARDRKREREREVYIESEL